MRLSTFISGSLVPASVWATIQLRGYSGQGCAGDKVIKLDLVNRDQCNSFEDPQIVRSARASGLEGCIVLLYKTVGCDEKGLQMALDEDNECEDAEPEFRAGSYEVSC